MNIVPASLKNISERLVEMDLLPKNAGDIKMSGLDPGLSNALRHLAKGALMIVSEPQIPNMTKRFLRVETQYKKEISIIYVLACNHQ